MHQKIVVAVVAAVTVLAGTVEVKPGQKATLELTYPGAATEKAAADVREIVVPAGATEILIQASTSE